MAGMKFSTGKRATPIWAHLYGVEGIGKTTFASEAPDTVFIDVEQGSNEIDTARFIFDEVTGRTIPLSLAEVLGALYRLRTEPHPYKTIALDTLDALEALVWAQVCREASCKSIEDFGYGKGYVIALNPWRQIIDEIVALREKGYNVITLGHAVIKPFKNPEGEDFDRYIPKLHEKAGALIKERANAVLFTNWRNATRKDAQTKRIRGVTDAARMIYTRRTAAYDAKNRYSLPDEMPLSWASFFAAVQAHKPADPAALRAAILEKVAKLPADVKTAAEGYLAAAGGDAVKLSKLNGWVNAQIPETDAAAQSSAPAAAPAAPAPAAVEPDPAPAPDLAEVAAAAVQRSVAAVAAAVDPLTPGVDVPAMAPPPDAVTITKSTGDAPAAPARVLPSPVDPKAALHAEILDAADKCKSAIDLAKHVLPLIKRAIDGKRFSEAELAEIRTWYTGTAAALTKAAAK